MTRYSLFDLRAAHDLAVAAAEVVRDEGRSLALWGIADDLWDRMCRAPIRSPGEAALKIDMVREACEANHDYQKGASMCLSQVRGFVLTPGCGGS
ncbi:hypothetical protein [Brevundimonas naejangsanensis]|nr:hypothetical protein [Brevundimonas naejangsanensis]